MIKYKTMDTKSHMVNKLKYLYGHRLPFLHLRLLFTPLVFWPLHCLLTSTASVYPFGILTIALPHLLTSTASDYPFGILTIALPPRQTYCLLDIKQQIVF
jgi:hypothetical protein